MFGSTNGSLTRSSGSSSSNDAERRRQEGEQREKEHKKQEEKREKERMCEMLKELWGRNQNEREKGEPGSNGS